MPSTHTGWKTRITEYAIANNLDLGSSKTSRMALKIHKRAQAMQEPLDFETGMRILGIYTDTTARTALTNLERQAA